MTQIANAGNTPSPVVSITRAFTRLKAAYISMFKRVYMFNEAGATDEETLRGTECEHLGNAKEATLFYHPQYVYNGCDVNDRNIDGNGIDRAPQTNFYNDDLVSGYS